MPKKPPLYNPRDRAPRTVRSAASLLQRITAGSGVVVPPQGTAAGASPLLEKLRGQLPPELAGHLVDAMEKVDELVCFVDSAAWAGRFKLHAAEHPDLAAGRRLTLRVMPGGARDGTRR